MSPFLPRRTWKMLPRWEKSALFPNSIQGENNDNAEQRATEAYQKECAKWEESYGEKATPKAETMHEKLQRYQEMADRQNASQLYRNRDKGAR